MARLKCSSGGDCLQIWNRDSSWQTERINSSVQPTGLSEEANSSTPQNATRDLGLGLTPLERPKQGKGRRKKLLAGILKSEGVSVFWICFGFHTSWGIRRPAEPLLTFLARLCSIHGVTWEL